MKILTLSFLTESKVSHASLSFIRRVAITLLVMLLTTASVWAQEVGCGTLNISTKVTPENVGTVSAPTEAKMGTQVQFTVTPADGYKIKNVSLSDPSIYSLVGSPQTGIYSFTIGSVDVTITAEFEEAWTITFYANFAKEYRWRKHEPSPPYFVYKADEAIISDEETPKYQEKSEFANKTH